MNNKRYLTHTISPLLLITAILTLCFSVMLFFWPRSIIPTRIKPSSIIPYQTKTYYEAKPYRINLSPTPMDITSSKLKVTLFNVSSSKIILIVNSKLAVVDVNFFVEQLNEPIALNLHSKILWLFIKICEIGKIMPIQPVRFNMDDERLFVNGIEHDSRDFKMALRAMIDSKTIDK